MAQSSFTTQLLPSLSSKIGILQLNNPASLNALTLDMVRSMSATLRAWQGAPIRATLLLGTSRDEGAAARPVFCAGGDVKAVYLAGQAGDAALTADFFREEYRLNHQIATQPPHMPQVSVWDGVVMGGGVGVSVHGKYRVATENTVFAMPECNIGFFPDVGATFWMPRLKLYSQWKNTSVVGGVGNYLALTGARLRAEDLMYMGACTHYIKSHRLEEMKQALVEASQEDNAAQSWDCATNVLTQFHDDNIDAEASFLSQNRQDIDYAFDGKQSVEEILASLESMGPESRFAQETLKTLRKMSPTSLKVTLEGLKRGARARTIGEALQIEYRMSQAFMKRGSDFYEGIRAALVDKDGNPKWSPATLEEVTDAIVESHFEELGEKELCLTGNENAKL